MQTFDPGDEDRQYSQHNFKFGWIKLSLIETEPDGRRLLQMHGSARQGAGGSKQLTAEVVDNSRQRR